MRARLELPARGATFFPKNTELSVYTRAELDAMAPQLNTRPRQSLGWMKPSEVFGQYVASTT
jgi:IS30 family transposase